MEAFAIGTGQGVMLDARGAVLRAIQLAADSGVNVLHLSLMQGMANDTVLVSAYREVLDAFLRGSSGRMVVAAAGDNGLRLSLPQLASSTDPSITALDRALARVALDPATSSQIIFVYSTVAATGAIMPTANVWLGAPALGAPGDRTPLPLESGGVSVSNGSSYSAAFVTGVAAQLWSLDPSLSAAEVQDYLLRGAAAPGVPRRDATGSIQVARDIGIGGIFPLDAFGALSRLSRERAGRPLCGVKIDLELSPEGRFRVKANRNGSTEILVPEAPPAFLGNGYGRQLSVARGGRRFAVGEQEYVLQGGGWMPLPTRPDVSQVLYSERDTLGLLFRRVGGRVELDAALNWSTPVRLTSSLPGSVFGAVDVHAQSFDPDGRYVVASWRFSNSTDCLSADGGTRLVAFGLRPGVPDVELTRSTRQPGSDCPQVQAGDETNGLAAWSPSGRELVAGVFESNQSAYRLLRFRADSGFSLISRGPVLPGTATGDVHLVALGFPAVGEIMTVGEQTFGVQSITCVLQARSAIAPHALVPYAGSGDCSSLWSRAATIRAVTASRSGAELLQPGTGSRSATLRGTNRDRGR